MSKIYPYSTGGIMRCCTESLEIAHTERDKDFDWAEGDEIPCLYCEKGKGLSGYILVKDDRAKRPWLKENDTGLFWTPRLFHKKDEA